MSKRRKKKRKSKEKLTQLEDPPELPPEVLRASIMTETVEDANLTKIKDLEHQLNTLAGDLETANNKNAEMVKQLRKMENEKVELHGKIADFRDKMAEVADIIERFPWLRWHLTPTQKEKEFRPQYEDALKRLKRVVQA